MPLSPEKKETWTAALFLAIGGGERPVEAIWPSKTWASAWQDMSAALETADRQLAALKVSLRKASDRDLAYIADHELDKVLGEHPAALARLLDGVDGLSLEEARAPLAKLIDALDQLEDALESSATVAACDGNPFGVSVSLKATLLGATGPLGRATTQVLSA